MKESDWGWQTKTLLVSQNNQLVQAYKDQQMMCLIDKGYQIKVVRSLFVVVIERLTS